MADLSKTKPEEVKMRLITQVGSQTFEEEICVEEKFMVDLIIAIRNGKSPADALSFLADVGSDNLKDPEVQISRANRIGSR